MKTWSSCERPRVNRHSGCIEFPFAASDVDEMDKAIMRGLWIKTIELIYVEDFEYEVLVVASVQRHTHRAMTP